MPCATSAIVEAFVNAPLQQPILPGRRRRAYKTRPVVEAKTGIHKRFAENFGFLRMQKCLADIAYDLGIDESTVGHWANGRSMPVAWRIPEVCRSLGCTANDLFAGC